MTLERETLYRDIVFRSSADAKWAAMADLLGWTWTYEPKEFKGLKPTFIFNKKTIVCVISMFPGNYASPFGDGIAWKIQQCTPDGYQALIVGCFSVFSTSRITLYKRSSKTKMPQWLLEPPNSKQIAGLPIGYLFDNQSNKQDSIGLPWRIGLIRWANDRDGGWILDKIDDLDYADLDAEDYQNELISMWVKANSLTRQLPIGPFSANASPTTSSS